MIAVGHLEGLSKDGYTPPTYQAIAQLASACLQTGKKAGACTGVERKLVEHTQNLIVTSCSSSTFTIESGYGAVG